MPQLWRFTTHLKDYLVQQLTFVINAAFWKCDGDSNNGGLVGAAAHAGLIKFIELLLPNAHVGAAVAAEVEPGDCSTRADSEMVISYRNLEEPPSTMINLMDTEDGSWP